MNPRRKAYIFILPSLFTTGNLFCGFYAIIRAFNHDYERAAYAIFFAAIFDALDGRVARMTKTHSEFGVEYDSIADVVSFGVAPAILSYVWMLESFGRLGYAGAFFFTACCALRLARFNATSEDLPKSYFVGLPAPAAANLVAATGIACFEFNITLSPYSMLLLTFVLGLLMVSNIRYRAFKDFDIRHRRSFFYGVMVVMMIAFMAIKHEITLFAVIGAYVAWGPVREGVSRVSRMLGKKTEVQAHTENNGAE